MEIYNINIKEYVIYIYYYDINVWIQSLQGNCINVVMEKNQVPIIYNFIINLQFINTF